MRFLPLLGFIPAVLAFAPPAQAELTKTIYNVADFGYIPKNMATCSGVFPQPVNCVAKPGYVFWVGSCVGGRNYLYIGRLKNGGTWCLRRDS